MLESSTQIEEHDQREWGQIDCKGFNIHGWTGIVLKVDWNFVHLHFQQLTGESPGWRRAFYVESLNVTI
jgi:hypothetical protein